jgi:hypothetical protein
MPLLYFINPYVLQKWLMVRCGDFRKEGVRYKRGNFSLRNADHSNEVSDEESQAVDKFRCTKATTDTKMAVFTMKATYQWTLHRLVIQVVLFHDV